MIKKLKLCCLILCVGLLINSLSIPVGSENAQGLPPIGNPDMQSYITREHFAYMLVVTLGMEVTAEKVAFTDVPQDSPYSGYIACAHKNGLISGVGDGKFEPYANVTREQIVTMLGRALEKTKIVGSIDPSERDAMLQKYTDKDAVSDWAKGYFAVAIREKLVIGTSETTLSPKDLTTVEQSTIIMDRLAKKIKGEDTVNGKQKKLLYENYFDSDTGEFVLEAQGNGTYSIKDGKLYFGGLEGGSTLWLKRNFEGDIYICYEAKVLEPDIAGNLNFFFMARDLKGGNVWETKHSGRYEEYHKTCNTYITTFVKKQPQKGEPGHARIRKDPGFALLAERMDFYTVPNKDYFIEIIKIGQNIEYRVNGETVTTAVDPNPYNSGAIGFRTWCSNCEFNSLKVYALE
ncbi:MAG: Endoglucanase precursor [Firmicutes bacterium ADurb.Bin193]|nr:MAG: Endoglucanase precursor [Firmicutes bacterium ADurb.Bin193]